MPSSTPLKGVVLVDCARANAKRGLATATEQCGYGTDTKDFEASLTAAFDEMGVSIDDFSELIPDPQVR